MTIDTFDGYRLATVTPSEGRFKIVGWGDFHVGSPQFNEGLFLRHRDRLIKEKFYVILSGDLLECATKGSVGAGVYEQVEPPDKQIEHILELLEPLKGQIIGAVKGNHEERLHKDSGIDVFESAICPRLGVPYFHWEGFWIFKLKHYQSIVVYACHTKSGAKNGALALNWMSRELPSVIHADLYFKSHDHSTGWYPSDVLEVNRDSGKMGYRTRNFIATGNYLGRADSYAAGGAAGHKPAGTTGAEVDMRTGRMEPVYMR